MDNSSMMARTESGDYPDSLTIDDVPKAAAARTKRRAANVTRSFLCSTCGHRILRAVTMDGALLELDTQRACFVVAGQEDREGLPVYTRSMAYPFHSDTCKGEGG